jgi:NAD(P)-dependent dehydrogenase (short-subunit alcohol dehydrogenase family)
MTMSKNVMIITGASRGIGAAIAWQAATAGGYAVCINYRVAHAEANALAERIVAAGGQAVAMAADVSQSGEASRLFAEVDRVLGAPKVLVNNAGIIGGLSPIEEIDEARLSNVFATNVYSAFYCCREFVRRASKKHGGAGGAIVNLSSAAARHGGMPNESFYAASKGAIDSLTVALAKEVGKEGIRVNALRPGLIATEMHEAHGGQELLKTLGPTVPIGRAGTADEVAEAVLWLASDASSYVHGALIDVSGGR